MEIRALKAQYQQRSDMFCFLQSLDNAVTHWSNWNGNVSFDLAATLTERSSTIIQENNIDDNCRRPARVAGSLYPQDSKN